MHSSVKATFLLITFLTLTACSYIYGENGLIKGNQGQYLQAKSIPPLKIPPGASSSSINALYPVSDVQYPDEAKRVSLVPPGLEK